MLSLQRAKGAAHHRSPKPISSCDLIFLCNSNSGNLQPVRFSARRFGKLELRLRAPPSTKPTLRTVAPKLRFCDGDIYMVVMNCVGNGDLRLPNILYDESRDASLCLVHGKVLSGNDYEFICQTPSQASSKCPISHPSSSQYFCRPSMSTSREHSDGEELGSRSTCSPLRRLF